MSLGADPSDWLIKTAILRRAAAIDHERRKAEMEALASMVGNRVGEVVVRSMSKLLG